MKEHAPGDRPAIGPIADTGSSQDAVGSEPVPYQPIDCSDHDRLEAFATLGTPCRIAFHDAKGGRAEVVARITDVFSRGNEEFLTTTETGPIRLDRLESVQAEGA